MRDLSETLQQIMLGLFVNGSYGIIQGDYAPPNLILVSTSVVGMYVFNKLKRRYDG